MVLTSKDGNIKSNTFVQCKDLIYILHYMWYITDVDRGSI